MAQLARLLQTAGLFVVGSVLVFNLRPEGITMNTMLLLVAFGVLLFILGTTLLQRP
ncbi:MAG: hypothetical protein OEY97_05380 [Nitrospirota bacterium]|nr:hypothetical protein [Nitrospirota bacterium]